MIIFLTVSEMKINCWSNISKTYSISGNRSIKSDSNVFNTPTTENQKPFDNLFGVNLYHVINEDTQKQIIVSEDNIERIRLWN